MTSIWKYYFKTQLEQRLNLIELFATNPQKLLLHLKSFSTWYNLR